MVDKEKQKFKSIYVYIQQTSVRNVTMQGGEFLRFFGEAQFQEKQEL